MGKKMNWQKIENRGYRVEERLRSPRWAVTDGRQVIARARLEEDAIGICAGANRERVRINEIRATARTYDEFLWEAYEKPQLLKNITELAAAAIFADNTDRVEDAEQLRAKAAKLRGFLCEKNARIIAEARKAAEARDAR